MLLFIFNGSQGIINVLIDFKGVNEIASLVTHILFIFIGVRELKVRHENNPFCWRANFLLMAISLVENV